MDWENHGTQGGLQHRGCSHPSGTTPALPCSAHPTWGSSSALGAQLAAQPSLTAQLEPAAVRGPLPGSGQPGSSYDGSLILQTLSLLYNQRIETRTDQASSEIPRRLNAALPIPA